MGSSSSSWLAALRFTSDEELPIHTLTGLGFVGNRSGGVLGWRWVAREVLFDRGKAQLREPRGRGVARAPPTESRCKQRSYRSGDRVEYLVGDRFDFTPVRVDREIGDLQVQRLTIGREIIEYGALVTGFKQGALPAASGAL